ncbi:chromatin modification-related protein EAF1 B-like isoform X3 [Cynara cardunculus var. scolymus]|uniref:chromatin modification-related protein EAF1 B-like isoform X3 n=1 Tax=Cynara cardunculus var. scolymus TaxID=59895 RepID=UPI000D62940B|nr:chromatin modification-related protein EAF1 B-like isoform X3 [Cynara cardunculus var. scolymus]
MHGCTSGSVHVVNAELDSMGGVDDSGAGISSTPSLQQSSDLEKTQAELRQTFTAAEKFRRELEYLQKGGDPLDLKPGNAASVSRQSTSLADRHPEQFVTSEAKGSFAITASPRGDSVESSGRLGAPSACEPNSADNLMLFDGDNKFQEIERKPVHPHADNIAPSKHHSQLDVGHITTGDSVVLELPKKSYKRRIRSRPNRDGARSSSTDAVPSRGGHFLPFRHASRDFKGLTHDTDHQDRNCLLNSNSKPKSPNASVAQRNSITQLENEIDGVPAVQSTLGPAHGPYSAVLDANALQNTLETHDDQPVKSNSREAPLTIASIEPEPVAVMNRVHLTDSVRPPRADTQISENLAFASPTNGFGSTEEIESIPADSNSGVAIPPKILDSESSCTQTSQRFDGYNGNGLPTSARIGKYTGPMEQNLVQKEVVEVERNDLVADKDDKILNINKANSDMCHPSHNGDDSAIKEEVDLKVSESALQNELKHSVSTKRVGSDGCTTPKTERKATIILGPNSISQDGNACSSRPQGSNDISLRESTLSVRYPTDVPEQNACSQNNLKLATKEREDSILEEARIIEAKRKRIAELSVRTLPPERRLKSQWDFVLEEMSWLANDFAQERLWKITAAAQISRRVAFASQVRFQQQCSLQKQKEVAHRLAEAVMKFWHTIQVKCKETESRCLKRDNRIGIQGYAMRFLEYNSSQVQYNATQAPATPDSIMDLSWEDNLTEENLFYTVPPGAIEAYRKAIESHLLQFERTGSSMQDEVDTSGYDAVADNAFEEDEGETSTYYLPGVFEGSKSTKNAQKRRKHFKFYGARSHEMGGDLSLMQSAERTVGTQPSVLSGKRSASSLNVSIPTKRVRTASRQRIISPFNAGTSGCIQAPNRTDASSGDTNSFQDEQSTLHGGSQIPNNMEAESVGDYEKQLQFDSTEVSNRPKKKKKAKHPGSTFEHRWHLDSNFQNEQKDHSRRRPDTHQFESNGSSVASQMSNMSNPNKFMKLLVRDRGRKAKALKTPVGQPGSGSPWSLFEDQALVVLVHDMGPNWELISDAINSTLQFKCIFRKSRECKERHKILMDRNTGDGADSAEDSGSSQPYPSTLPGIPEGSARQLFQRLQGPMEEDTLKSHFEKIIVIGQKHHYRRTQNDNQDPKQLQQPHSSHAFALSQVCPNNLNGGPVLTPLELSEAISSSPDVLPAGYQGPHSGGLPVLNHGPVPPMLPGSGSTSSAPGSSNSVHGSNLPSASAPLNPSVREGRYGIPRTGSLSVDEQQRMQQYNQMLSARNTQQASLPPGSHSVTDRGVRMLPAGNGMGVMCGMNRSVKMARPNYQGIASPSMLSSGNILPSGSATPNPASMHSGAGAGHGPGQGNSMLRPRDGMHMIRPNQNTDHQKAVAADLQMQQVSQGGVSQGVPAFGSGTSSSFPNQISQPPVQAYPLHHQQQARPISPQQSPHLLTSNSHHPHHFQGPPNPAYGMRLVKERQLQQQRLLQQQQQQFSTSNAMMLHAQPQESQLPVSSPQNSTQMQSRSSSPPVSISPMMTPMPQLAQKHPVSAPHGLVRNPQTSGTTQMVKQQQRQRQSQQFQQRQQAQHQQQQAKIMKGGRGTMMMHQNHPTDTSEMNGFSGGQSTADKGEQQVVHHLPQSGQGSLYSGKQSLPHSSMNQPHQQKTYSSKELQQQKPSHSADNNNHQNHAPSPSTVTSSTPSVITSSNHHPHRSQPHQKSANHKQATVPPKVLHNQKVNPSDQPTSKLQAAQAESPMSMSNSSQPNTTLPMPHAPCNDANSSEKLVYSSAAPHRKTSEMIYDSSGAVPDNAGTQFGKNSMRMSPPQTSGTGMESEHSGPAVNQVAVHRQSSSESLPNPVRNDVGVQWQQQPPS